MPRTKQTTKKSTGEQAVRVSISNESGVDDFPTCVADGALPSLDPLPAGDVSDAVRPFSSLTFFSLHFFFVLSGAPVVPTEAI